MLIKKLVISLASLLAFSSFASVSHASSLAAGLPSASYSSSGTYGGATAETLFNSGGWNSGGFGNQWAQVNLLNTYSISGVNFLTNQTPNGVISESVFVSNSPIGNSWASLTPVALYNAYTTNGTAINFSFAPVSGQYVEIVANGGPSWTALGNASVIAAPVPEPETYGMILAGLGLMGFMVRRKKNV